MEPNTREVTILQGVLSLLAALMCGWLGMVLTVCALVLIRTDEFLICCLGVFLLPTVAFFCCRHGWRHTAAGRKPGEAEPPPIRTRLYAVALFGMTAVSTKLPMWLSEALSGKPSNVQLARILSTKKTQMERVARIILQHQEFEFAYRHSSGKVEIFPTMPNTSMHEEAIYTFMKETSTVDLISVEPQSRVVRFQTWTSDGGWFARRVRGVAFSDDPPEGTVSSIDNPGERNTPMDTHFQNIQGSWYAYETSYDP